MKVIHPVSAPTESPQQEQDRLKKQAILLTDQVQRSPIPVALVCAVEVYAIWSHNRGLLFAALLWWLVVLACLFIRRQYGRRVVNRGIAEDAALVMRNLTLFAFLNGLAVGACAPLFFGQLDDPTRAITAMILIGLSAAGVVTSAAYPPVFLAYVLPAMLPLAASWAFVPDGKHGLIGLLVILFIGMLFSYVRKNFALLKESFSIRYERDQYLAELQKNHTELLQAKERAEEAGQAKARVLAAASHDLRQPLHALSLYSAVLSQQPDSATLTEVARQIDLSVRSLSALLNALLDISKLDAGVYQIERRSFAVRDVLGRIVDELTPLAQKKQLTLHLECPWLQAWTDPVVFEQIARNLIDNAIKYTDSGVVLVTASIKAGRIALAVQDSGRGIPLSEQARVFEEFYQLHNPGRNRDQGLGLGLSIVKRLAELIDSEIVLQSEVGKGSCFSWHIPLEQRGVPPGSGANVDHEGVFAMSKNFHILLIEDEAAIRHGMCLLLKTWGIQAHGCENLAQAQQLMQEQEIVLVIADLRLASGADEENGLQAIQTLRIQYPHLRALLISGETDPEKLKDVAESGIGLMNKPIMPEVLRTNIVALLEQS